MSKNRTKKALLLDKALLVKHLLMSKLLWFLLKHQFPELELWKPQREAIALLTMHQIQDEQEQRGHWTSHPENTSILVVLYRNCSEILSAWKRRV